MSLVEDLQRLVAAGPVAEPQLEALRAALTRSIPKLRAAAEMRRREMRPGRFICHRCPTHGFVVMVLGWGPGDATPIHDHGVWGVEGVLEGTLTVTEYDDSEAAPRPLVQKVIGPGATMSNLPPKRDVHKVENSGSGLALSVHIYGREITGNRIFVAGKGFQPISQKAAEYAFLDVAGVCEADSQGWGLLWSESSML